MMAAPNMYAPLRGPENSAAPGLAREGSPASIHQAMLQSAAARPTVHFVHVGYLAPAPPSATAANQAASQQPVGAAAVQKLDARQNATQPATQPQSSTTAAPGTHQPRKNALHFAPTVVMGSAPVAGTFAGPVVALAPVPLYTVAAVQSPNNAPQKPTVQNVTAAAQGVKPTLTGSAPPLRDSQARTTDLAGPATNTLSPQTTIQTIRHSDGTPQQPGARPNATRDLIAITPAAAVGLGIATLVLCIVSILSCVFWFRRRCRRARDRALGRPDSEAWTLNAAGNMVPIKSPSRPGTPESGVGPMKDFTKHVPRRLGSAHGDDRSPRAPPIAAVGGRARARWPMARMSQFAPSQVPTALDARSDIPSEFLYKSMPTYDDGLGNRTTIYADDSISQVLGRLERDR